MTTKKILFLAAALGMAAYSIIAILYFGIPGIINNEVSYERITIERQSDELDRWLDKLERYECPGCGPSYKRLDSNGEFSYGCLQFQEKTFFEMGRRYNLIAQGDDPVTLGIYECRKQKEIARAFWLDPNYTEYQKARHWYTTIYIKGLGVPTIN